MGARSREEEGRTGGVKDGLLPLLLLPLLLLRLIVEGGCWDGENKCARWPAAACCSDLLLLLSPRPAPLPPA